MQPDSYIDFLISQRESLKKELAELKIIRDKLCEELYDLKWPHLVYENEWLKGYNIEYCIDHQMYHEKKEKERLFTELT